MNSSIVSLSHLHADARRLDLLAEAASQRLVNEALDSRHRRSHSVVAELRHKIGVILVSFGHRLQHQPAPADHGAAFGNLRTAR